MALLCHCHVVPDRRVAAEIEAGAASVRDVGQACEAGTSCGGCVAAIEALLERMTLACVA